jgi:hypothetical protein
MLRVGCPERQIKSDADPPPPLVITVPSARCGLPGLYLFPTAEARERLFFSPRSTLPPLHLDSLNLASRPPGSKPQRTLLPLGLGKSCTGRAGVSASMRSSPPARAEVIGRGRVQVSDARSSRRGAEAVRRGQPLLRRRPHPRPTGCRPPPDAASQGGGVGRGAR